MSKIGDFFKDVPFVGNIISGVGDYFSGKSAAKSAKEQQEQNLAYQREFAQSGVAWRVNDANNAGVHPLFALGAQTTPFTPGPVIPDEGRAGPALRTVGNAVSASQNTEQRALLKAQIEGIHAGTIKDHAEASYWRAQAAKISQAQSNASPWPELATDQDTYHAFGDKQQVYNPYSDAIVRRANPELMGLTISEKSLPFSKGTHGRAGLDNPDTPQPLWSQFETGDGPIILPFNPKGQSVMEALEGIDAKFWPILIAEQRRRFGDAGVKRLLQLYDPRSKGPSGPSYKSKPGKSPADSFQQLPAW